MQFLFTGNEEELMEDVHAILLLLHSRQWSVMLNNSKLMRAISYFVARIHVDSFPKAMKRSTIFDMIWRQRNSRPGE